MAESGVPDVELYAEEWLQVEALLGGRFVLSGSVDEIRQQFGGLWANLSSKLPPPSDAVVTEDVHLPHNGPRVRVYKPKSLEGQENVPIGLYIHSGGFVTGAIENEDHIARDIAERVPMVLVSTSYRLAPENPFPAGLEDCITSYKWIRENAKNYGASPDKIVPMGGSAGGNLAAAVTLSLVNDPNLKPKGLISACASSIYPDIIPEEYKSYWHPERLLDAALLNRESMMPCMDAYGAKKDEPLWSLLLNENLAKLPKTWLVACSKDPTYDEMRMFNDKVQKAGVDVTFEVCKGYPHFFWMLPMLQKSHELLGKWAEKVREITST